LVEEVVKVINGQIGNIPNILAAATLTTITTS
jgi:hypothetical protein